LTKDGYTVSIVQSPTISLADDVAATKRIVAVQKAQWFSSATPTAEW
jgi:hypothetical protein